jgi:hypothetical protein
MSDWDAILGEAALRLDPAKLDLVRAGPGSQASTRRNARSSAQTLLDPQRDPPTEPGAASHADRGQQDG